MGTDARNSLNCMGLFNIHIRVYTATRDRAIGILTENTIESTKGLVNHLNWEVPERLSV